MLGCGRRYGRVHGVSVVKCAGAWGEVRRDVGKGMGGVEEGKEICGGCKEVWGRCERVYGVSLESVSKCVGRCGEGKGRCGGVKKCGGGVGECIE